MANDLELDFSEITWETEATWGDSWLEMDFSEIEWGETETTETEGSKETSESTPEVPETSDKWEEKTEEETSEAGSEETKDTPEWDEVDEIEKLLSEIESGSEDTEETIKKAEDVVTELWDEWKAWEAWELIEQMKVDNAQLKTQVDQLNKLVSKINKEKWDIMMKNTELELYGNLDDPNLVYLNWNLTKAKEWDEKSKKRIVSILDNLRSDLVGATKEEEDIESKSDLMSKITSYNSTSNPNKSWGQGWIDDYEINL